MSTAWLTFNAPQNATGTLRRVSSALMCLVVVLMSSNTASASCGDYLFRNGKPVSDNRISHIGRSVEHDVAIDKFGPTNGPERAPMQRCSGPNCSNSPVPFAPMPSAPLRQIRSSELAALVESILCRIETRGSIEFPESERGARYLPSSIFRPPAA